MDAKQLLKLGGATKVFASAIIALLSPAPGTDPAPGTTLEQAVQSHAQPCAAVKASLADIPLQLFGHDAHAQSAIDAGSSTPEPAPRPNCSAAGILK